MNRRQFIAAAPVAALAVAVAAPALGSSALAPLDSNRFVDGTVEVWAVETFNRHVGDRSVADVWGPSVEVSELDRFVVVRYRSA